MASKLMEDSRIDQRIKDAFGWMPARPVKNFANREEILLEANSPEAKMRMAGLKAFLNSMDFEKVAPSEGLRVTTEHVVSSPDGNTINIQIIRPDNDQKLPCVYYIHGGGMAVMSCYLGNYAAFGRMIASFGVVVAMVDFRNCVEPSSVPEVAPFPAGLNDCVSGLKWIHSNGAWLNIDSERIVVAGESGGGNLTLALGLKLKQENDLSLVKGLYALCPSVAGEWPQDKYPSSIENNEIFLNLHSNYSAMAYGIDELHKRNPLAWPGFATGDDVKGFPATVISVNECDPLKDEGIAFYRLLLANGVQARCRVILGTTHGIELVPSICPDLSRDAASHIASLCWE